MEDNTKRKKMALPLFIALAIVVAAVAIVLTWQQPAHDRAEAAGGGPEMTLSVSSGATTCPLGTGPDTTCIMAGDPFSLTVEAIGIPAGGYILTQAWLDYGATGLVPKTFNNTSPQNPIVDCGTALINPCALWPDVSGGTYLILHDVPNTGMFAGGLTSLFPPQPQSVHVGDLFSFSFTCDAITSSHTIDLLAPTLPGTLPGTSGSLFTEFGTGDQITPKVDTLTIKCLGPTPTPSDTPVPPTDTPTVSPTPTDTPTPLPPPSERPDVRVTKVDLVDPVDSGGAISYQITVKSIGLQTAEDVVVVDTLPAGSVFKSATSTDATCNHLAGVVTCEVTDDMAPTDDPITIDITINAPTGADELIDNLVTVSSTNEPFANTGNNKDIEQTMVLAPRSDVTLSKVGDPTFLDVGGDVTYTLVAKNLGPHSAQNVQIVDTLPDNASFVSATAVVCSEDSGEVTCDLGDLAPDEESIVQIVMNVPNVTRSILLKNSAVVSADNELFLQTGNNLAVANTPVVAPPPDLVVSKTDSQDPVLRLGFYSYEITVRNDGNGDALNVVVTDTLPFSTVDLSYTEIINAATFESAVGATCEAIPGDKVECTIAEINVGLQVVITLNVRAPTLLEDENVKNSVTVSASDPDEDPVGNDASESTLVRACFDVTGDLIVDLPNDILTMMNHVGLSEGDIGYNLIYDFDGDGHISLPFDLLPVLQHFAQDCSLLL